MSTITSTYLQASMEWFEIVARPNTDAKQPEEAPAPHGVIAVIRPDAERTKAFPSIAQDSKHRENNSRRGGLGLLLHC